MECIFIDGLCSHCGHRLPAGIGDDTHKTCNNCQHLGPTIEREGITIKVKCGCNEHDQPHVAHECAKFKRCLPTLIPVDLKAWEERKPESDIYHLCHGCTERTAEIDGETSPKISLTSPPAIA